MSISGLTAHFWRNKDILRVGLQSLIAALLAYAVMQRLGLHSNLSWAIISALFAIHGSLDATFSAGAKRLLGAAVGVGIGIAVVFLFSGLQFMPLRIALVAAITNALAASRPQLDYAAAAGAVVALQPSADLDGALGTAVAVGVGGGAGIIASVSIWPELGRHRAQRLLASALRHGQKMIDLTLNDLEHDLSREEREDRREARRLMITDLEAANATAKEVRFRQNLRSGASIHHFTLEMERLWHSLIIVERVIGGGRDQFGEEDYEAVMPHIGEAHAALCELLAALAEMVEKNRTDGPPQELWDRFHTAQRKALASLTVRESARDSVNERAIQTLLFGLEEIRRVVSRFQTLATDGPGEDDGALT
ncbi:MAG TPA: FUSC family protein [Kiloniellales bacterium]|nr:FUSC family protein [Kiloniellales bacterium]